jgi:hypothetical protein
MTTQILSVLLIGAAFAQGQSKFPIPKTQIETARKAHTDALNTHEDNVLCSATDLAKFPSALEYCRQLRNIVDPSSAQSAFAIYFLRESLLNAFLGAVADSRLDEHNGASTSGAGTTSAVVRAGISDVVGLALESGAITQTQNGSSLTLQGNALSIERFLTGQDVFESCPNGGASCYGPWASFLSGLSGSSTLNLSSTSSQNVTGTVTGATGTTPVTAIASLQNSAAHLTSFTVRYQIYNDLDLRSKLYVAAWKKVMQSKDILDKAAALDKANQQGFLWFSTWSTSHVADYTAWLLKTVATVRSAVESSKATDEDIAVLLASAWDDLLKNPDVKPDRDAMKKFLQAADIYLVARDAALATAKQETASGATLEYTYSRPTNQPRLSTVRFAYTLRPGTSSGKTESGGDTTMTINLAADFYNSPPPGTGSFRDFQAGLQFDHHFNTTVGTVAGYYQYQHEASAIQIGAGNLTPNSGIVLPGPAATLLAPKGNLAVIQAKLTFPLKNGTQLPVGVTWSNRTELIKSNEVRGHIGFDFDWSSLLLKKGN